MRPLSLAIAISLAACARQTEPPSNVTVAEAPAAIEAPQQPAAAAVSIDDKTDLLDFHLGWPAEVSAIPALATLIRKPAEEQKAVLLKAAAEDRAMRTKEGYPFNGYQSSTLANVEGQTARLLSVSLDVSEYSGGAHPNHGTKAILWDKSLDRRIDVADLFTRGSTDLTALLREPYCAALAAERRKKRGEEDGDASPRPDGPFDACPQFGELALIPKAGGAALSTIVLHADPYVAGPYAEGDYDIELPVTAALIAALKPEYRSSFAVQPQ